MRKIPYSSVIGLLNYAQVCTRSDNAYIVGILSKYLSKLKMDNWKETKGDMRYLKRTNHYMLIYRGSNHLENTEYSNFGFC